MIMLQNVQGPFNYESICCKVKVSNNRTKYGCTVDGKKSVKSHDIFFIYTIILGHEDHYDQCGIVDHPLGLFSMQF